MYLLFNVSTNGKPKNWKAHYTDTFSWPKILHITWLLYDEKGKLSEQANHIISPMATELDETALKRSGLTEDQLKTEGIPVQKALEEFSEVVEKAQYIFAFNMQYSENVVMAEFYRTNMNHKFMLSERFCLMRESTYFCRIPGPDGKFKWPTLTQLHNKIYNVGYDGAGNAQKDILALSRCFSKLLSKGQLDDIF